MYAKVALAASVLSLFVQSASAGPCVRSYTIQAGDICDSISAAQNVSTYQLATINAGVFNSDCTNLAPGSSICLGYENEDCSSTYVVAAQDTCDSVATTYGINSTLLYGNNPQINSACSNIYVGEVLCVASTIAAPPAGTSLDTAIPSTATAAISATPIVSSSVSATPSVTSVFSSSSDSSSSTITASAVSAAVATDASSGDDDDDLPYCDEL